MGEDTSIASEETPTKYKQTEEALVAASKYLETIAGLDLDDVYKFATLENDARSELIACAAPPHIQRMLAKFVRSALASFIKNRALVEDKNAREREQEKEKDLRRRKTVRKAHLVGFVVALLLLVLVCCLKQGAFYYAISCAGCIAAALGVGGWFYKTAKSEKDASDEPKKEGKAEQ